MYLLCTQPEIFSRTCYYIGELRWFPNAYLMVSIGYAVELHDHFAERIGNILVELVDVSSEHGRLDLVNPSLADLSDTGVGDGHLQVRHEDALRQEQARLPGRVCCQGVRDDDGLGRISR